MFDLPTPEDLKRFRKRLGLTQTQLAERAGVSQSLIARIEAGDIDPRLSTLRKIVNALKEKDVKVKIPVERIMKTPVIHVSPDDTLGEASRLMEKHGISQLPVLENYVQVGNITEDQVLEALDFDDPSKIRVKRVAEVMGEGFPTVSKDTDVKVVSKLIESNRAVLVVEKGKVKGIVTKADLLRLMER
ncbi:CBS domain-containing protein [Candidatus Pyrohabitans sp.]